MSLSTLMDWVGDIPDQNKYLYLACFWFLVMIGLFIAVWNDKELWAEPPGRFTMAMLWRWLCVWH